MFSIQRIRVIFENLGLGFIPTPLYSEGVTGGDERKEVGRIGSGGERDILVDNVEDCRIASSISTD
jgi:hypothetical protein